MRRVPVAITIAGSDSGGGAGIQADLKTFLALGVFGTSAITCLTAQNPEAVTGIAATAPRMVALQIQAVCRAFPVAAAKTGMLYSAGIIGAVAAAIAELKIRPLVVDPVMVATSGARLLREDAVAALRSALLPLARVVTPNVPEAEILWGHAIGSLADLKQAAAGISRTHGTACLAKGGHLAGDEAADVLCDRGRIRVFSGPRVHTTQTHGTGCTLSAALTAFLARGETLERAAAAAKAFVTAALTQANRAGRHCVLNFLPHG